MRHLYRSLHKSLVGFQESEAGTKQSPTKATGPSPVLVQQSEDRYRQATFICFALRGLVPPDRSKTIHENRCLENPAFP